MNLRPVTLNKDISLTPRQKEITESILYDLTSKNDITEILLKGYAGTGKTFITSYIAKQLRVPFVVTAPIHKAVSVISKATNATGMTIHSLHGIRLNMQLDSFDATNPQFDPLADPKCGNYKVQMCDEGSQVPYGIYLLNKARAKEYGYKILYIGDEGQLPPIKEKVSKVFGIKKTYELTDVMRQEENSNLLKLFKYLRGDLINNTSESIKYLLRNRNQINDGVGYELLKAGNYAKSIMPYYTLDTIKNVNYCRNVSYTNDNVGLWNTYIRRLILGNDLPLITVDDVFTSYTTIVDEFNEIIIANSSDYRVGTVRDYTDDYGLKTFAVNFIEDGGIFPTKTLQIIDHTHEETLKTYKQILTHLYTNAINATTAKGKAWKKYMIFKDTHLCMIRIELLGGTIKIKKDIDYGYALTAHKAQGSTYDNVTVDLQDIMYYRRNNKFYAYTDIAMRNKLLYVALSRARNLALIRSEL